MRAPIRAFTLIELLIVVAIIAILAAIAVPNFLEAQTRSKVSRTRADMRSIAVAIEAYRVDSTRYPAININPPFSIPGGGNIGAVDPCVRSSIGLTTPVAYLSSIPSDPFGPVFPDDDFTFGGSTTITDSYYYSTKAWFDCRGFPWKVFPDGGSSNPAAWVLQSKGPDKYFSRTALTGIPGADELDAPYRWQYDPTNGTISAGNIVRSGP
jgi:prepilin-type N-terminal cleavage/methylation domain-containing protein